MPPARPPATSAAKIRTVEGCRAPRDPAAANLPNFAMRPPKNPKITMQSLTVSTPSPVRDVIGKPQWADFGDLLTGVWQRAQTFPVQGPPARSRHTSKIRRRCPRRLKSNVRAPKCDFCHASQRGHAPWWR